MLDGRVIFHPLFRRFMEAAVELEEMRSRAQAALGPEVYKRVEAIIEQQPQEKRAACYGTIAEAALCGSDFSKAETIRDIGEIYARFIIRRAFGGDGH